MLLHSKRDFTPPIDVVELEDRIIILAEIAGMTNSDFNITLDGSRLIVTGVRHRPIWESPAYHRVEIGFGEFKIEIPLIWSVKQADVSARYNEGFLSIELPRQPERQIRIGSKHE